MKQKESVANKSIKWLYYCVFGSSLPIAIRAIIYFFPGSNIDQPFLVSDLIFYGIALHLSVGYELTEFSRIFWANLLRYISKMFLAGYITCSVLTIVKFIEPKQCDYLIWFIFFSFFYCCIGGIYGKKLENCEDIK